MARLTVAFYGLIGTRHIGKTSSIKSSLEKLGSHSLFSLIKRRWIWRDFIGFWAQLNSLFSAWSYSKCKNGQIFSPSSRRLAVSKKIFSLRGWWSDLMIWSDLHLSKKIFSLRGWWSLWQQERSEADHMYFSARRFSCWEEDDLKMQIRSYHRLGLIWISTRRSSRWEEDDLKMQIRSYHRLG